jgi:uncharacterized LabA/DUF88 family protein
MEPLRTVMFIDGRNFKYNLRAFRFESEPRDPQQERYYALDEKHFVWREFFLGIIKKYDDVTKFSHRLVRVYWYNAETMRPFEIRENLIQEIMDKYCERFRDLTRDNIIFLAKNWYDREREYFYKAKEQIYENIQRKTDFLEFKYTGEYVVQPFTPYKFEKNEDDTYFYQGTREGEKGVDVGISVDMIDKMQNYDVAVLISGDADFAPLVRYIKDNLKHVYQFSIAKGIPPRITYLSPWLMSIVDVFQFFDEVELLTTYLNRESGIPPVILQVIDDRISQLRNQP